MDTAQVINKWEKVALTERSAAQQHFLDRCELVGHLEYQNDFSGGARLFVSETMSSFLAGQRTITVAAILRY